MRTILAFLLAATLSAFAQTSVITGTVKAPDGTPWQTEIQFLSKTTPIGLSGNLIPTKLTTRTATNGTFSQALFPGSYQTTIKGAPGASGWPDSVFYIYVTTNLGTYNITALMTNAIALPAHVLLTKGSIYVWNGTNVVGLAAGGDGQVLTADATSATGLKYTSVAGTGTMRNVQSNGVAIGTDIVTLNIANPSAMTSNNGIVTVTLPTGGGSGGGDTNANFILFGATNSAYPNARTLAVGGINTVATNGTNITITATEVGTVTDAQLASGTNSVKNYADATFQPLSATLTGWAAIATNLVAYVSQLGTAAYSNAAAFQPANAYLSNVWSQITTNLDTTKFLRGDGQWAVPSGSGGGNNFNPNQFETNGASQVQIKSGATTTNNEAYSPVLKFSVATGGPLSLQEGNNGVGLYDGITEILNFNQTNCYFTQPLFVITPTEDSHAATKAYVDSAVSGSSGSTNVPHLTATNGINILTNGSLIFAYSGYGDPSNYKRGVIQQGANSLDLGTYAAGTGASTSNAMALTISTWGTNRAVFTPTGDFLPATHNTYDCGVTGTRWKNGWFQGGLTVGGTVSANAFSGGTLTAAAGNNIGWNARAQMQSPAAGRIVFISATSQTNHFALTFGAEDSFHTRLLTTNLGIMQITHGDDLTGTNTVAGAKFDIINRTNIIYGTTTITGLGYIGSVPTATKSITNTWYSRTADNSASVTNVQVYINGVLTSWTVNGGEL